MDMDNAAVVLGSMVDTSVDGNISVCCFGSVFRTSFCAAFPKRLSQVIFPLWEFFGEVLGLMLGETDSRVAGISVLTVRVISVAIRAVWIAVVGSLMLKGWTPSVFVRNGALLSDLH